MASEDDKIDLAEIKALFADAKSASDAGLKNLRALTGVSTGFLDRVQSQTQAEIDSARASANTDAGPFTSQLRKLLDLSEQAAEQDLRRTVKQAIASGIEPPNQSPIDAIEARRQAFMFVNQFGGEAADDPEQEVGLPRLIRFGEDNEVASDFPAFMMDARVYIQGVEVSKYLSGSIQVNYNGVAGHNTCTLVLDNEEDKFLWTEDNLLGIYGTTRPDLRYLQEISPGISFEPKWLSQVDDIKRKVYQYKADPNRNPRTRSAKNVYLFSRFDLVPNKCIFAKRDPIRVFIRYPFRPPSDVEPGRDLWMPFFTGYVQNVSIDDDALTGTSHVTIESADIRNMLIERMRISTDVNIGQFNPIDNLGFPSTSVNVTASPGEDANQASVRTQGQIQNLTDRFYTPQSATIYDDIVFSIYGQPFSDKPLEEAIRLLLVYQKDQTDQRNGRGVREIEFGGNFYYDNTSRDIAKSRAWLESYHKFTLFGPKRRPWTTAEMEEVGRQTTTDGAFSPERIRLWQLLPKGGSGAKQVADLSSISINAVHEVNWTDRMAVLRAYTQGLDYELMVGPHGDMFLEFNMADFRPEDFGVFKEAFRFRKHTVNAQFGDEQGDPVSAFKITTGFTKGASAPTVGQGGTDITTVVAFAPYIAARYGVTVNSEQIPHLQYQDRKVAQQRAIIELQKANSRVNVLNFQTTYRPWLLPNRPIHHVPRTRMGTAVTVDYDYGIGSAQPMAGVSLGLDYVRTFTGMYRSPADLLGVNLNQVQLDELAAAGFASPEDAAGIDPYSSVDPLELQVYTSVMAGDSLPMSNRNGWGGTVQALAAAASGVYVVDPFTPNQLVDPTPQPSHGERGEVADVPTSASGRDRVEDHKFKSDPLKTMVVVCGYGPRTLRGKYQFHPAVDLRAEVGTPIYAVDDGTISQAGFDGRSANGRVVTLNTRDGYRVKYIHLSSVCVEPGQPVVAGQQLGATGNTGDSLGPHLHLQVQPPTGQRPKEDPKLKGPKNGEIDPMPLFPGTVPSGAPGCD